MNKEAQEYLENILKKDPAWLIEDDIKFLNARRDYLTDEQKRVFASVLGDGQAPEPTKTELVAKLIKLDPSIDESTAKKMKNDDLKQAIAEKEAVLA